MFVINFLISSYVKFLKSWKSLFDAVLFITSIAFSCFPDEQIRLQTASKGDGPLYRALCSLFVRFLPERYGTRYGNLFGGHGGVNFTKKIVIANRIQFGRSHSILLVDRDDNVTFLERRMKTAPTNIDTAEWETTIERFKIDV